MGRREGEGTGEVAGKKRGAERKSSEGKSKAAGTRERACATFPVDLYP